MSKNKTFAYLRVSTKEQKLDRQRDAVAEYCRIHGITIDERDIFVDKESGKDFERSGYIALKNVLRSGDTVIVKELDRLGRNKEQIKKELEYFKESKIAIRILNIPTTLIDLPDGSEWVMDMINNILIEVMAAIAEEERNKIRSRQAEGIKSAKEKGKHLGRPEISCPANFPEQYVLWKSGEITTKSCMESLGLKPSTFYRRAQEYENTLS